MAESKVHSVFISHISDEALVAELLKFLILDSFSKKVNVFVSTDYESISSGEEWYRKIVDAIMQATIVVALISRVSVERPWINFECGVAAGSGGHLFPLVIRDFRLGELKPPLQPLHARDIHDIRSVNALLGDIGRQLNEAPRALDIASFIDKVETVERLLPSRALLFQPVYRGGTTLNFELTNAGNRDVELIAIDVDIPAEILDTSSHTGFDRSIIEETSHSQDGVTYRRMKYKVFEGQANSYYGETERLPRFFTPSMGTIRFRKFEARIRSPLSTTQLAMPIYFQVHARDVTTEKQSIRLGDILEQKGKA